ncbi:TPA: Rib/alpha-like domain-containing protein, partial [Streptococcus suis]
KNAVTLPEGVTGTVTVPEDASVRIGTKENAGKPVVLATVTYPDGTSETIEVPVKQKDTAKFTATVTEENKPALITSSDAVDTPITDQTDKDAILAKVTVPAVNGQEASITSKEITSPVKEVNGKKVVEVTVTYEDGTVDEVNVPVDQKDSEANNPTVKDPDKPALISVPATENTPVTSEADKNAITDKVNVEGLPNTPTSVAVPDGATVAIDPLTNKPVVPVTVTYPDGTTDTINVPVKQADAATHTPSLKPAEEGKPAEALISVPVTADTPITSQEDKDAITAKVDTSNLPDGTTVTVPDGATVAIVDGKPVVPVTVTYPDGTTDTINVPVKQADAATHTPSLKPAEEGKPAEALISVPATADTPITSQEDKDAITAKVDTSNLPEGTTVTVPDGAKVTIVDGKPVVPVTVTYPDGTTDTINVPVKQADNQAS